MASFVRQATFGILLTFFVISALTEAHQFIGPRLYEANEKSADTTISSKTAVALKDEDFPYVSASEDKETKSRHELFDFIENMDAGLKFLTKDFDRDGMIVVRTVKTVNVVDPPADTGANAPDNTARSAKPKRKLSSNRNFVTSPNDSPFKRVKQDKCDKTESIPQSSDAVD